MSQLAWSKLYQFLPVFVLPLTFLCLVVFAFEWNKKTDFCSFKLRTAIILGGAVRHSLGACWNSHFKSVASLKIRMSAVLLVVKLVSIIILHSD